MKSFPMSFQTFQSTAPSNDSLSGGVVEIGTLALLAGQFVICKGVAVNQGPASAVSLHVTANLKGFIGSELDPVSS